MLHPPDHGLPLIQLKERRRELVVALQNRATPVSDRELAEIAAIQQAILAIEDVVADLDCENEERHEITDPGTSVLPAFGRRGILHSPV